MKITDQLLSGQRFHLVRDSVFHNLEWQDLRSLGNISEELRESVLDYLLHSHKDFARIQEHFLREQMFTKVPTATKDEDAIEDILPVKASPDHSVPGPEGLHCPNDCTVRPRVAISNNIKAIVCGNCSYIEFREGETMIFSRRGHFRHKSATPMIQVYHGYFNITIGIWTNLFEPRSKFIGPLQRSSRILVSRDYLIIPECYISYSTKVFVIDLKNKMKYPMTFGGHSMELLALLTDNTLIMRKHGILSGNGPFKSHFVIMDFKTGEEHRFQLPFGDYCDYEDGAIVNRSEIADVSQTRVLTKIEYKFPTLPKSKDALRDYLFGQR